MLCPCALSLQMDALGHDAQPQQAMALPEAAEVPGSDGNVIGGQAPTAGWEASRGQSACLWMIRTLKSAEAGP